jgi:[glutamine synthetase] adenylyltransferase / [glutamine synthetase]-adenylyl-L-tyrosine phosphorylase
VDHPIGTYTHAQIAQWLDHSPESQRYPQLAAELLLALRSANHHVVSPATIQTLGQAILTCVDPGRALTHLLRYLDCLPQPAVLWDAWQHKPQGIACTIAIFAGSQFLSNLLWRRPQLLLWLLAEALWAPAPTRHSLHAELEHLLRGKDTEAEVGDCLRAFTQQHMLRIGARDLNGLADVVDITADLSAVADCVIQTALQCCQGWLAATYGQPFYTADTGQQHPCHFCVIGMGKLGGEELNFSSDVDLMYVYTSYQGQTTGVRRDGTVHGQISNHEYFVTLSRRLTNLIGGKGPEGEAFRVDLRLRPDGTQGQLALSLLSYEAYYARLGQTWEKMALLRARPVAGEAHLGAEFMALVQPFMYQRHLDPAGIRQLQGMKQQIDGHIADKAQSRTNVKLGLGGIREIEFFVQLLQLLFGGRYPVLQERHTLRALTRLQHAGLVSAEVAETLRQTYGYLRRIEHVLQMEQGSQTHTLPRSVAQQQRLARYFGYTTWEEFYHDYLARTDTVHALFTAAFEGDAAVFAAPSGVAQDAT